MPNSTFHNNRPPAFISSIVRLTSGTLITYVYFWFVSQTIFQSSTNPHNQLSPPKPLVSTPRKSDKMFFQNVTLSMRNSFTIGVQLPLYWCIRCYFSLFFLCLCGSIALVFAFRRLSPSHPLRRNWQCRRGGHTGASRFTCAISAASAETAASQKCRFSGSLPCSRPPFRRGICKLCKLRRIFRIRMGSLPVTTGYRWSEPANLPM